MPASGLATVAVLAVAVLAVAVLAVVVLAVLVVAVVVSAVVVSAPGMFATIPPAPSISPRILWTSAEGIPK